MSSGPDLATELAFFSTIFVLLLLIANLLVVAHYRNKFKRRDNELRKKYNLKIDEYARTRIPGKWDS